MPGDSSNVFTIRSHEICSDFETIESKIIEATPGKHLKSKTTKSLKISITEQKNQSKSSGSLTLVRENSSATAPSGKTKKSSSPAIIKSHGSQLSATSKYDNNQSKPIHFCTSCSSNEIIEVNIKLKSCQNCQNVVIDEMNYDNQPLDGDERKSKTPTAAASTSGSQNFYHHQLAVLTRKLKNMYRNRIHSTCGGGGEDDQSLQGNDSFVQLPSNRRDSSTSVNDIKTLPADNTNVRIVTESRQSIKQSNRINSNCKNVASSANSNRHDNLPDVGGCSSKISSISTLPQKSNENSVIKDAVILRICDLDLKLKSIQTENSMKSPKHVITASEKDATIRLRQSSKISTTNDGSGDSGIKICEQNTTAPTRDSLNQKHTAKSAVECKRNSEKNSINVKNRKDLAEKFRQNKSKSLDILPGKRGSSLNDSITSKDVYLSHWTLDSNGLNKITTNGQKIGDDVDDDAQYESINSVELIFISDEFLNKAIKHDLKILTNKQTVMKNVKSLSGKKKSRKLETTISPIKLARNMIPHNKDCPNIQISPVRPDANQSTVKMIPNRLPSSATNNKKLIIISEDFKRRSLENNVVIVDNGSTDDINSGELNEKRKSFQQANKLSRQQSSIDDVANQMVSHAFRSFEEPEEQCLENKEFKTTPE